MSTSKPWACVCDGRYDGCEHGRRCGAEVTDDRWGPWCSECNPRRFAHIDSGFASITKAFESDPAPPTENT